MASPSTPSSKQVQNTPQQNKNTPATSPESTTRQTALQRAAVNTSKGTAPGRPPTTRAQTLPAAHLRAEQPADRHAGPALHRRPVPMRPGLPAAEIFTSPRAAGVGRVPVDFGRVCPFPFAFPRKPARTCRHACSTSSSRNTACSSAQLEFPSPPHLSQENRRIEKACQQLTRCVGSVSPSALASSSWASGHLHSPTCCQSPEPGRTVPGSFPPPTDARPEAPASAQDTGYAAPGPARTQPCALSTRPWTGDVPSASFPPLGRAAGTGGARAVGAGGQSST